MLSQLKNRVKGMFRRRKAQIRSRPRRHPLPRHSDKRRVVWIVVLLLCSLGLPLLPLYISYLYPKIIKEQSDWFFLKSFHFKIYEYYYFKETAQSLAWICRTIAFTKTAVQYSTVVFLAAFLILCYLVFDLIMFWVNYNTWAYAYEFIILFLYITVRGLIRPYKPDAFAKVKSIF